MREIVTPFPDKDEPVTSVRGTLIVSSLNTLRVRGHFERYAALLPSGVRTEVLMAPAASWCPIDLAQTHYRACEALQLSDAERIEVGKAVGSKIQSSFVGTILRRARDFGTADPWLLLAHLDRIWARMFEGGGTCVLKTGPKDALVQVRGGVLMEIPYFREAFVGVLQSPAQVLSRSLYCRSRPYVTGSSLMQFAISWV